MYSITETDTNQDVASAIHECEYVNKQGGSDMI